MKYTITFVLLLLTISLWAQSPDMERMKRDIEVAENILASLMQESPTGATKYASPLLWNDRSTVEGSYLEGFGILFTISPQHLLGLMNWEDGQFKLHEQGIAITVPRERARVGRATVEEEETEDSLSRESQFREVVHTFATDYAYLMRQLPAGEKIMIRYGGKSSQTGSWGVVVGFDSESGRQYSAVIEKSDLDAHQSGRITREQLLERIKFTSEAEGATRGDRDLALLASIFSRLYQSDLTDDEVFRMRGTPRHEKIEGLGAIIHLNVGGNFPYRTFFYNGIHTEGRGNRIRVVVPDLQDMDHPKVIVEDNEEDESVEKKAEEIDAAYPAFLEELQQNIVEYGSIVKDLGEDEALIFRVKFFDCPECRVMPPKVEITAAQKTLEAYRKGTITLDKAVQQLKVSKEE